ncbi:tyrosinase family protein [Stenotrophomonas pennii]|uniref:tyrosinase family protein n=1 Tax=Stenotrophomonas lacuserhaii TaxID=2760084 RepID=UPI0032089477
MLNRRSMMAGTASALALASGLAGSKRASAQQGLRVRRNIANLSLDDPDLVALRQFVEQMRGRNQSNATSWIKFADIHGGSLNFNHCQHSNWYFLPWHRAYLDMYEKAVIEMTGHTRFAMPYWDWSTQRAYPAAFSDAMYQGKPNPLFSPFAGDDMRQERKAVPSLPPAETGAERIRELLNASILENFGGGRPFDERVTPPQVQNSVSPVWLGLRGAVSELESGPHNYVHDEVNGYMGFPAAARDPLFFLHHANVDRIWENWILQGHVNTTDPLWLDMVFPNHFLRLDGQRYSVRVDGLRRPADLGYKYDDSRVAVPPTLSRVQADAQETRFKALCNPAATTVIPRARTEKTGTATPSAPLNILLNVPSAPTSGTRVFALLRGSHVGSNLRSVRVFVNLPVAGPGTPTTDPHYVTSINFFANKSHQGTGDPGHCYSVELTRALKKLGQNGPPAVGSLTLQLVPIQRAGSPATDLAFVSEMIDVGLV